jgi:hypothetical protein
VNVTKKTIYVDLVETMYKLGFLSKSERNKLQRRCSWCMWVIPK